MTRTNWLEVEHRLHEAVDGLHTAWEGLANEVGMTGEGRGHGRIRDLRDDVVLADARVRDQLHEALAELAAKGAAFSLAQTGTALQR